VSVKPYIFVGAVSILMQERSLVAGRHSPKPRRDKLEGRKRARDADPAAGKRAEESGTEEADNVLAQASSIPQEQRHTKRQARMKRESLVVSGHTLAARLAEPNDVLVQPEPSLDECEAARIAFARAGQAAPVINEQPPGQSTKTGLLWAEAEEQMEKRCCVEASVLPAVVTAAEYSAAMGRTDASTDSDLIVPAADGSSAKTQRCKNADAVCTSKGAAWVGRIFYKSFPGYGRFQGTIVEYLAQDDLYAVQYEDGDAEDLHEREVRALLSPLRRPAGMGAEATKLRHEHDTRSPQEEAERDRQWTGFDQGDVCVRRRCYVPCNRFAIGPKC